MKLKLLTENNDQWYKGLSPYGGSAWYPHQVGAKGSIQLGFMSTMKLAYVYAQPTLTGEATDRTLMVAASIPAGQIEDRTAEYFELWKGHPTLSRRGRGRGSPDVSIWYPPAWRDQGPWTVTGDVGAHNSEPFVYVGIDWPYEVIAVYNGEEEWANQRLTSR